MRDVVAMVLAGGRVEELAVLTLTRPKAAIPFAGQYRIIDFALSSLMHADLERVGVVSLYRPSSLIDHLGIGEPWDLVGRGRGVRILPPYTAETERWYRGTADAIFQNLHFISKNQPRDVLILSGDHVYGMDFRPFLQQHRETDADLTMVVKSIPREVGRGRFGFAEVDEQGKVVGYEEKPSAPRSDLVSLTIYLFKTEVLVRRLEENQRSGETHQLYSEVLPKMVGRDRVYAHCYTGYWNYARSLDAFHQAHMDLLGEKPPVELNKWGLRSRQVLRGLGDLPPARFAKGGSCTDSLISPGVDIAGSVVRSVLSPGVRVEAGAQVSDAVIMHDGVIGAGAKVDRAVLDKGVRVGAGAQVGAGEDSPPNRQLPASLTSGISVVGKAAHIPPGAWVGRNCLVYPQLTESDWESTELEAGASMSAHKEPTASEGDSG